MDPELLEPYDRLVRIVVLGRVFEVPANNLLLRQLQFLCEDIGYGKYCWNGECRYCEVHYALKKGGPEQYALACRVKGLEGMRISRMAPEVKYNLSELLAATPPGEDA
jgi:hypothetical protein